MTALLVALTFGALGLAGAMLFYVLRLTREERDRSEARAAALADMISAPPLAESFTASGQAPRPAPRVPEPTVSLALSLASDSGDDNAATAPGDTFRLAPLDETPRVAADERPRLVPHAMFGAASSGEEPARPRLLLVPAIGLLIVGLALAGVYVWNRPQSAAAATAAPGAPLELVSLRHQRQGDALVVSGLVRNPHAGRVVGKLAAVTFTFDRQGTFLASGRAPLDFPELRPGDESPFTITVPQTAAVSRYRVSFRTDDGVVAHVDRRAQGAHPSEAGAAQ
jgi:hypothetical protein